VPAREATLRTRRGEPCPLRRPMSPPLATKLVALVYLLVPVLIGIGAGLLRRAPALGPPRPGGRSGGWSRRLGEAAMYRALLSWSLKRASAPGGEAFAARSLPRLQAPSPHGARGGSGFRAEHRRALGGALSGGTRASRAWLPISCPPTPLGAPGGARTRRPPAGARGSLVWVRRAGGQGAGAAERLERLVTDGAADCHCAARSSAQPRRAHRATRDCRARCAPAAQHSTWRRATREGRGCRHPRPRDRRPGPERAMQIVRDWLASGDPVLAPRRSARFAGRCRRAAGPGRQQRPVPGDPAAAPMPPRPTWSSRPLIEQVSVRSARRGDPAAAGQRRAVLLVRRARDAARACSPRPWRSSCRQPVWKTWSAEQPRKAAAARIERRTGR